MPEGFDAGSIFVRLRTDLAEFNAGLEKAKASLDTLGGGAQEVEVAFQELDTSVVVFKEIEERSSRVRSAFATMGAETKRATEAMKENAKAEAQSSEVRERGNLALARSANRILAVQLALLSLSSSANGPVREAFQAISNGVSVAAASIQLLQGKIGLLAGGLIGVGVAAVSFFVRAWEEAIKKLDAATDAEDQMIKRTTALSSAISDAKLSINVFGGTAADELTAKLRLSESAFAANLKRIREISDELRKLRSENNPNEGIIAALEQERTALNRQNDDIRKTGVLDKVNADVAQLLQATRDLKTSFDDVQVAGQAALNFGISQPAEVSTRNLQEAKAVFDKLVADNLKIVEQSQKYGLSQEQRDQILSKLHPQSELQGAANTVIEKKRIDDATKAVNDLAATFSTSVGDGLRDAILNAQKPLDALTNIGKNLFGNMIDQTVKRLESGLTDAFKSITGAAGEGIGLALTGILGAAGAVLSKLGSKGTDKFNGVQSAVTSTVATRGIVAGPSSVAIATVGDNLSRAVAPLLTEQQRTNGILEKIEKNTRGGGRGGVGSSNVAVATA